MRLVGLAAMAALWLVAAIAAPASAINLFDFETDQDITAWKLRTPATDSLKRSSRYATSGTSSLEFHTPEWKEGMEKWPAFEAVPPVKDWRGYDRFMIDITNSTAHAPIFHAFISDGKRDFRQGVELTFHLPVKGSKRFVFDISELGSKIDSSQVSILHLFTDAPKDLYLYIDNITLLKPGEKMPALPASFVKETTGFIIPALKKAEVSLSKAEKHYGKNRDYRIMLLRSRLNKLKSAAADRDKAMEMLEAFDPETTQIMMDSERLLSLVSLDEAMERARIPSRPLLIGFADSMSKVLPRGNPPDLKVSRNIGLSIARNEKESFQVVVTPAGTDTVKGVSVSVGDLKASGGKVLEASNIDCDVMGYVQTKVSPPYPASYVGWWPDPILDFLGPVDVKPGDLQSFWIRVRVPKNQTPGLYKGKLTVTASGAKPVSFGFSVQVRKFTMPDCTPIPTATTTLVPEFKAHIIQNIVGSDRWHSKVKYEYADFLSDYYIDYDSLYDQTTPDFDILKYKNDQGRLVAFNYGYFGGNVEENINRFKPIYEKSAELGINDKAYIYGFDENHPDQFPALENAVKALKENFPEVFTLTTAYDASYGMESVVKSMEGWTPLTPSFDPVKAEKARALGKKVWWYICCGPQNPYANWFIEYPAIQARLLMGAMTAKYKPDGFLYYSWCFWNDNKPITTGPFTTWNPVSWTTFHGDGSIMCYGEGGKLIPTIRLENYRDGLEDTAYALILEDIIKDYEGRSSLNAAQKSWLTKAKNALEVPKSVVENMAIYTADPNLVYKWRNNIADMIDSSDKPEADPWGKGFGVRGFKNN